MNPHWESAHVRFDASLHEVACDDFIVRLLTPFATSGFDQGWLRAFFFVRYFDSFPHVRIRFRVSTSDAAHARQSLQNSAGALTASSGKIPESAESLESTPYPATNTSLSIKTGLDRVVPILEWRRYEPEFYRYGGAVALERAHDVFNASSSAVLMLLTNRQFANRAQRLGTGLAHMLLFIRTFLPARVDAARFASVYGTAYLHTLMKDRATHHTWRAAFDAGFDGQRQSLPSRITEIWNAFAGDEPVEDFALLQDNLNSVRESLFALHRSKAILIGQHVIEDWAAAVRFLLPSYVHMNSNRLGLTITEEIYLAHLIHRTLSSSS